MLANFQLVKPPVGWRPSARFIADYGMTSAWLLNENGGNLLHDCVGGTGYGAAAGQSTLFNAGTAVNWKYGSLSGVIATTNAEYVRSSYSYIPTFTSAGATLWFLGRLTSSVPANYCVPFGHRSSANVPTAFNTINGSLTCAWGGTFSAQTTVIPPVGVDMLCVLTVDASGNLYTYCVTAGSYQRSSVIPVSVFNPAAGGAPYCTTIGSDSYTGNNTPWPGPIYAAGYCNRPWTPDQVLGFAANPFGWVQAKRRIRLSSGGTVNNTSPSGSCAASGTLRFQVNKTVAGSSTGSGALLKTITKPVTGSVSVLGTIANQARKTVAGSATPSGTLAKQANKAASGSCSASGTVGKAASKPLGGSTAASGTLAKQAGKPVAGSVSPSGTVAKQAAKPLSGSATPSGSLANQAGKPTGGSTTPSGTLANRPSKAVGGSSTPSGTLAKAVNKPLAGSSAPSGGLSAVRMVARALGGALTAAGSLVTQVVKYLAGLVTPSGGLTTSGGTIVSGAPVRATVTVIPCLAGSLAVARRIPVSASLSLTTRVSATAALVGSPDT